MEKQINKLQHNLIIGGLLGDLHIQKTSALTQKCRLRFCHGLKQKEYVDWKYNVLKKEFCVKTKPPYKTTRKISGEYVFYTQYCHEFLSYHSLWYESKVENGKKSYKKILPSNISQLLLDPVALAVWYLDDGSKRIDCNACRFASQSFSEEENLRLQGCLQFNFNLFSTMDKWWDKKSNKFRYGICIPSKNFAYREFKNLLYDFVQAEIPSMLYKL